MAGRKGDISMVVAQHNAARNLVVESIDETLGKVQPLLGYGADEMVGHRFTEFLPPQINEQIDDYLDYDAGGRDLADVLSRCRNFGLMSKSGKPVKFSMRIQRHVTFNENARFLMLMRGEDKVSEGVLKKLSEFRDFAETDRLTDLPTGEAFLKACAIAHEGVRDGNTIASIAIIELDDFAQVSMDYSKQVVEGLLKEVALRCRQTFRDADVAGYAGGGRFGVLLLEADAAAAMIPLQRLRTVVANQPLYIPGNSDVSTSLSIAFRQLNSDERVEKSINLCEEMLVENAHLGNQVLSV